jgi:branched-subunit amino acid permease
MGIIIIFSIFTQDYSQSPSLLYDSSILVMTIFGYFIILIFYAFFSFPFFVVFKAASMPTEGRLRLSHWVNRVYFLLWMTLFIFIFLKGLDQSVDVGEMLWPLLIAVLFWVFLGLPLALAMYIGRYSKAHASQSGNLPHASVVTE